MTALKGNLPNPPQDKELSFNKKSELIGRLSVLRNEVSSLGLVKVALCLDYAHWELFATVAPREPEESTSYYY